MAAKEFVPRIKPETHPVGQYFPVMATFPVFIPTTYHPHTVPADLPTMKEEPKSVPETAPAKDGAQEAAPKKEAEEKGKTTEVGKIEDSAVVEAAVESRHDGEEEPTDKSSSLDSISTR
ncbi:MAG: hypothetical protein P4L10_12400 [Acidobacteriaceae bacterium]|nr:hypothetical protein [Acidobacteriaceae bacterium]